MYIKQYKKYLYFDTGQQKIFQEKIGFSEIINNYELYDLKVL